MKVFITRILLVFSFLLSSVFLVAQAAAPDGSGPWADEAISWSQGLTKSAGPVPADRSDETSAVGPAESTLATGTFFSLGFGGNIVLRFDNGISNGVFVVESTNPGYAVEHAQVELSADGSNWHIAGNLNQSGSVSQPEEVVCAQYVRITDTSNPEEFEDTTADAYDVDGVQAVEGEPCTVVTPTPTPVCDSEQQECITPTITPTPTNIPSSPPPPPPPSSDGGGNNNNNNNQCTDSKPPTPTLNSVNRSGSTATLSWSAVSPASHYSISYGTSPGSYAYGVPNTGNVTSFTVGGLNPGTVYYFVVRAVNGCMPGDPSGQNSTGNVLGATTGGQVLGASTDTLAATGSRINYIRLILASGVTASFFLSFLLIRKFR